jgi:hypothetical protein
MPITSQLFAKYPNPCLIETGSYIGDGIQAALDAGFARVHSIELAPKYHQHCVKRFSNDPRVVLHLGDSSKLLRQVIAPIQTPITFWLDGHWSCGDTGLGEKICPLMEELDAIATHPIKNHTLLIDDLRGWRRDIEGIGFDVEDLLNNIRALNPDYHFTYEDSPKFSRDILAATV